MLEPILQASTQKDAHHDMVITTTNHPPYPVTKRNTEKIPLFSIIGYEQLETCSLTILTSQ